MFVIHQKNTNEKWIGPYALESEAKAIFEKMKTLFDSHEIIPLTNVLNETIDKKGSYSIVCGDDDIYYGPFYNRHKMFEWLLTKPVDFCQNIIYNIGLSGTPTIYKKGVHHLSRTADETEICCLGCQAVVVPVLRHGWCGTEPFQCCPHEVEQNLGRVVKKQKIKK